MGYNFRPRYHAYAGQRPYLGAQHVRETLSTAAGDLMPSRAITTTSTTHLPPLFGCFTSPFPSDTPTFASKSERAMSVMCIYFLVICVLVV